MQATKIDQTSGYLTTKLGHIKKKLADWGQSQSLWTFPFVTSCCAVEYKNAFSSEFNVSAHGLEDVTISPERSDLLIVSGIINLKMAPYLKEIYHMIPSPKWVISFGTCACSAGMYSSYFNLKSVDQLFPVDLIIPGCPPSPQALLEGLITLQNKIHFNN